MPDAMSSSNDRKPLAQELARAAEGDLSLSSSKSKSGPLFQSIAPNLLSTDCWTLSPRDAANF
eukprot:5567125-Karenia_brevis.AAC.1